jgi:hypothetical protein
VRTWIRFAILAISGTQEGSARLCCEAFAGSVQYGNPETPAKR